MMNRRAFLRTLSAGLLAAPLAAEAQQAGRVPRIGFLSLTSPSDRPPLLDAFRQRLRELGWVEGQNIVIDYRYAEGRVDRLPDLAAELVRLKVDLIIASAGTQVVTAAKNATETIPIVMIAVRDPVGIGLIASLARPGGNVTGVSGYAGLEIVAKQLELLKETVPKIRRVAILSNPSNAYHQLAIREVNVAARSLGVQLQLLEARGPNEFDGAFAAMAKERVGALLVLSDAIFSSHRTRLADLAARSRLPAAYGVRESVEAGGLMSYGPSFLDLYRRSAAYVDKILKGAKPADLAVEQPTKFELVINLKTAKALGLTLPPSLLQRADQIIE
ncbi:MAG TPA: ABC transporter substrate-binding protein [Candidatus Acidoferrum sp.]|nr:ABC transporter substrate-binding protein [Candidatus Acidoferrum sp.]